MIKFILGFAVATIGCLTVAKVIQDANERDLFKSCVENGCIVYTSKGQELLTPDACHVCKDKFKHLKRVTGE